MLIGLLYEGSFDDPPLRAIINRLALEHTPFSVDQIAYKPHWAGGQILTHMKVAEKIFFQDTPPVDLAVFVSDVDKYPSRKKEIPAWIREYAQISSNIVVCGLADPNFEHWLMQEGNAVKAILSIPPEVAIYSSGDPKAQLRTLYEIHNTDLTLTLKDLYIQAANTINIDYLASNDQNFNAFVNSLRAGFLRLFPAGTQGVLA